MHMADALLSPATAGVMWLTAGAAMAVASRGLRRRADDSLVPRMGMLGAFVFAAQMLNFSIPGTGSSGHLGGALLLAVLLGPQAALIVVASVLTVQALFFADGGLLALGANLFNLGVLPCFVAYPLVYRPLAGAAPSARRRSVAAFSAALVGALMGALAVVAQTMASGITSLPAPTFLALMLPIHAAIGIAEGLATAALLQFLQRSRPELLRPAPSPTTARRTPRALRLALVAALLGGVLPWFASTRPDGLEWSVARAAGSAGLASPADAVHTQLAALQQRTALLPGYTLPEPAPVSASQAWPAVDAGTSLSAVVGGIATVVLVVAVGLMLRRRHQPARARA